MALTANGALSHATASNDACEDALMTLLAHVGRNTAPDALRDTLRAASPRLVDTVVMGMYVRDPRGGKGERRQGRRCLEWLARTHPDAFVKVVDLVPTYGRWDDLAHVWHHVPAVRHAIQDHWRAQLRTDLELMGQGRPISLAAKWVPREKGMPALFRALAADLGATVPRLRKDYLVPLRRHLDVVERNITTSNFAAIDYSRVPSCAMQRYKAQFLKKDGERFRQFLADVQVRKTKMCARALFPAQLVHGLFAADGDDAVAALEAQWQTLSADLADSLPHAVAVVDTSGSMGCLKGMDIQPIHHALAMGLLLAQHARGAYRDHFITFSAEPQLYHFQGGSLRRKLQCAANAPWHMNTNVQAVFDLLLQRPADMPDVVFVFSDMQFDNCGGEHTNWGAIKQKFTAARVPLPKFVFWNLASDIRDFAVRVDDHGAVMLSGCSHHQFDLVRRCLSGDVTPRVMLDTVLHAERYADVRRALAPPAAREWPCTIC